MDTKSSFLGSPKWNGVAAIVGIFALAFAGISFWLMTRQAAPKKTTGVVQIQRSMALSILLPQYFSSIGGSPITLSINGKLLTPGHLQMRLYTVRNLTDRPITASDFDTPITVRALGGRKIIGLEVSPPANRPPIKIHLTSDMAVISPVLLNVGEMMSIQMLLQTPKQLPIFADPYKNDEGVLKWTAEIKGAELSVTGADRDKTPWLASKLTSLYIMHQGDAVIAITIIGLLLSLLQLGSMAWRYGKVSLDFGRSVEITLRIALAWAVSEALVSFADTPYAARYWVNSACFVVYVILLLPLRFKALASLARRLTRANSASK